MTEVEQIVPVPVADAPVVALPQPASTSASIYVGDLNPDVTEAVLFEIFNQVGPVASIRVCRDAVTRRSLGYAYVNFHSALDAERALDTLNYSLIKDRPCRLMWSQRDPSLRKSGLGNIFIKNLDPSIDNKSLHDTFSAFGNILSCKVVGDDGTASRGYGFVHYETQEAADLAIAKVNGMLLNGKKVVVCHHVSRREREAKVEEYRANFTNIYVKNLDESVTDEEFLQLFSKYGTVSSSVVVRDVNGNSKGFGFVNFEHSENAKKAVEELNNSDLKGKPLYVARAQKKSEREEQLRREFEQSKNEKLNKLVGVNLYIKNLDDSFDDEKLRQEFAPFGTITSAKVMCDAKGNSKGFGFVCYSSPEEATKAVTEMNGRMVGTKPVYVAIAQRKEDRRNNLEIQHAQRQQFRQQLGAPIPNPAMYGAPPSMYYNIPQNQRGMIYPPQMQPRPRWTPPQYVPNGRANMYPQYYPHVPVIKNIRPGPPMQGIPPQNMRVSRPPAQGPIGVNLQPQPGAPVPNNQRRNFKAPSNFRNPRENPNFVSSHGPVGEHTGAPGALNPTILASLSPEQQKQVIGEHLYPLVQRHEKDLAGKITGMLLDLDISELLNFLESPEDLKSKVSEALEVLRSHSNDATEVPPAN